MAKVFTAALALLVGACASVPQKLDAAKFYKRDMLINGAEGTLVLPRASAYDFDITSKGKMDMFTFETCHRALSREKVDKRTELTYKPVATIEDTGSCVVRFGGFERDKGRHSWGIVDFEDPATTLPAMVFCNGLQYNSRGVTICQSKAGLVQRIVFPSAVVVSPTDECPMPVGDGLLFEYKTSPRECVYNFIERALPNREHRLTTLGYDDILIREN